MLMHEEPTLFGAPPGRINRLELIVEDPNVVRRMVLRLRSEERNAVLGLEVYQPHEDTPADMLGAVIPLILRSSNLSRNLAGRTLWAIHNRLGREGFEVSIQGCGKDPMPRR